jgi:hypothetical protein
LFISDEAALFDLGHRLCVALVAMRDVLAAVGVAAVCRILMVGSGVKPLAALTKPGPIFSQNHQLIHVK